MENWKDIKGYEGLYQISDQGNVFSVRSNKILKLGLKSGGYKKVNLSKNGLTKTYTIHRLVAEAFIPNPNNLPCINHKDERLSNNCVDNLEWCTVSYNINYGTRNNRVSKKLTNGERSISIKQLSLDGIIIAIWPNAYEAKRNGYSQSAINECCQGKRKTHKGYKWEYLIGSN